MVDQYPRTYISVFFDAFRLVFKNKLYSIALLILSLLFFGVFVYIPVTTIPGNDLAFQLQIMTTGDYGLFTTLSILASLSVVYNVFIFLKSWRITSNLNHVGNMTVSGFTSFGSSVMGSMTCLACGGSLFLGYIGIGGAVFIFKYRLLLTVLSISLMIISLYFSSRKVLGVCTACSIKKGDCK